MPEDETNAPPPAASSEAQHGRDEHASHRGQAARFAPSGGDDHTSTEPRTFTVVRCSDESGVSGTGRVLDGCIFHNGQVVICWRGDINSDTSGYSSLAIYPCWEAFHTIHIAAHPGNKTEVVFGHSADLIARLADQAAEREPEAAGPNDDSSEDAEKE